MSYVLFGNSDIYDPVLEQRMVMSLRSAGTMTNHFSNVQCEKAKSDSETFLARDLLNVLATIPSNIYLSDDCQLHAYVNGDAVSIFKFAVKENPEDEELAQSVINEFHDELSALTQSGLIPSLSHNQKSNSFTVKEPNDLFEIIVKTFPYLEGLNKNMARVLYSTAISIYDEHSAPDINNESLFNYSDKQHAIIRALKSVVLSHDNTSDFTITAEDEVDEHSGEHEYSFDISVGKDTPMSFEKRFRALSDVYHTFDAVTDALTASSHIALWGCQTGFSIRTTELKSLYRFIESTLRDPEFIEKVQNNQARLYISPSVLNVKLNPPKAVKTPYLN